VQMLRKGRKQILVYLLMLVQIVGRVDAAEQVARDQIESGIYIFVSFSMNDESLRRYFEEAKEYEAKLVVRGFFGDKNNPSRFDAMRQKAEQARINVDINPNLFEGLAVESVPVIAVVGKDKTIKRISGHITLNKALELMEIPVDSVKKAKSEQANSGKD
jgi:conjugal transfer pilus assembly protein TrbC